MLLFYHPPKYGHTYGLSTGDGKKVMWPGSRLATDTSSQPPAQS